jgi:hypothetical protein
MVMAPPRIRGGHTYGEQESDQDKPAHVAQTLEPAT